MQKTALSCNPFKTIPDDLKALIFEYIPLLDYACLASVCKDFNFILNSKPDLWAKHLFRDFLDSRLREIDLCDDDFLPEGIAFERIDVKYSEILNSKRLLVNHYNLRKQWSDFFKPFLDSSESLEFVEEVLFGLKCPSYPPPSLKKDIHYFYTNTMFQNFLTEIHFCIQGRSLFQDKKQSTVNLMANHMEGYLSREKTIHKDHLINVRWYNLNFEVKSQKSPIIIKPRNRVIKKREISCRRIYRHRENSLYRKPKKPHKSKPTIPSSPKRNRKFTQSESVLINLQLKAALFKESSWAERFYWMMQDLTENYCKMVLAYLKIIHNPYLLLIEYTRLWNKFVLLVIDFTQTFFPFANIFNKFYEQECRELPNFPEFSTWRLMVKIWYEQVYCNLNYYLAEAFRSILMLIRSQEKFAGLKFDDTEKCSFCVKAYETDAGPDCLYSHFFYNFLKSHTNDISRQEIFRVLKDYYQAISDLSYNEYSIFYWDCNTSMKGTPKENLDSHIFQDSQKFYDHCKNCVFHDADNFKKFFDNDNQLIENIMGQPFAFELQKQQILIIKSLLQNLFISAVKQVEFQIENSEDQNHTNFEGGCNHVNLEEILKLADIDQQTAKDQQKMSLLTSFLSKQSKIFNTNLFYINEKQEQMEERAKEFDEIRDHRYLRGFNLTDERYSKFFELGQNPTLKELNEVGMEGKNTKEELESLDVGLVFL